MNDSEEPDDRHGNSSALAIIQPATGLPVPAMIAAAGEHATLRFIDFFTAHTRNPNTRVAYGATVRAFFDWLAMKGVNELGAIRTHHVSTYIELLTLGYSAPTVKQHLARSAGCSTGSLSARWSTRMRRRRCAAHANRQERQDAGSPWRRGAHDARQHRCGDDRLGRPTTPRLVGTTMALSQTGAEFHANADSGGTPFRYVGPIPSPERLE
jgi:hypothetical protein